MVKDIVIALDMGTSGCRAAAVRADGTVAAQHYVALFPARPAVGLSEYQADTLFQAAERSIHAVLDKIGPQNAAALAVTSQRSSVVLWNRDTGEPVGPVLTWEDGRARLQAQDAPVSQEEIHLKTGLYKTPFFSAPKIAWSLQNVPQAISLVSQGKLVAAPIASYIIWKLTGGKTFAADYTLAQRTLLFDVQMLSWSEALCNAFSVPREILPSLQPSAGDYGTYAYRGVSIPICACVGDQQAAAVYFQLAKHKSLINYGTGAFWLYNTGADAQFLPGMLTSLAASTRTHAGDYLLEGPVNAAASALLWLKAQGILFEEAELDTLCTGAQHPVLFLPAFGGLGAPYWDFETPTSIDHLSPRTRKPDWVAGVVRAIAFLLADIAAYLRDNGCPVEGPVQVSGGLSHCNYLTSFQADVLQLPLEVSHQADATVLGAAQLAFSQLGVTSHFAPVFAKVSPSLPTQAAGELHATWQQFVARVRKK